MFKIIALEDFVHLSPNCELYELLKTMYTVGIEDVPAAGLAELDFEMNEYDLIYRKSWGHFTLSYQQDLCDMYRFHTVTYSR